jgi:hypothetical protein
MGPLRADGTLRVHASKTSSQLPTGPAAAEPAQPPAEAASPTPQTAIPFAERVMLTPSGQPPAASEAPQTATASPTPSVSPAGGSACGLQFQGATKTFSQCQSLTADLGDDYTVLWNYTPLADGAGGTQGRLDVALDAAAKPNSYIAFGIPQTPDTMVGGSAIIVKTDAAAPSGEAWA